MHKFIVLVILLSFSSAAFADLNLDHLSTTKLPPSENSELAANIFLLQLALKNKSENDELLGEGICIDYSKPNSADKDSTAQNFKIVTSNGVYASGSSRVDRNSPEFKKLKNLTGEMKKYFDTIGAGPRARTVGFTDGQHISGSSDQAAANKKLGQRRAVNIANALGIENFEADSFVSENGYELPQDQRECSKRRVTTIEFDAKPKLSFGQEHSYTPRFKMIKDHKAIKKYAMRSALKVFAENGFDLNKTLEALPKGCNNGSTKKVLEHVQKSSHNLISKFKDKNDIKKYLKVIDLTSAKLGIESNSKWLTHLKLKISQKVRFSGQSNTMNYKDTLDSLEREDKAAATKFLLHMNRSSRLPLTYATSIPKGNISQSNHIFDCFDVKDYFKDNEVRRRTKGGNTVSAVKDISHLVKNSQIKISFSEHDFKGQGNHLHCNQCKSGMRLTEDGKIVKHIRTSKEFTNKTKSKYYSSSEHADASRTIKLSDSAVKNPLDNFSSMASHKSLKVLVIKNCDKVKNNNIFASDLDSEVVTINSLPFNQKIDVKEGQKICVVNMPVINTCTIEPEGTIKTQPKSPVKSLHYYKLNGEAQKVFFKHNANILANVFRDLNDDIKSCTDFKFLEQKANDLIKGLGCKERGIEPPVESDNATSGECPQYSSAAVEN